MTVTFKATSDNPYHIPRNFSNMRSTVCSVYNPCSVINPQILVEKTAGALSSYTHFFIAEFGRTYKITNVTAIEGERCIITGTVDVLASHESAILNSEQHIIRTADPISETSNVPDPKIPTTDFMLVDLPYITNIGDVGNGVDTYIISTLGGSGNKSPEPIADWYDWTEKFRKDSETIGNS